MLNKARKALILLVNLSLFLNLLALEELIERTKYFITYSPEATTYELDLKPSELREVLFFAKKLRVKSTPALEKEEKEEYSGYFIRIEDKLGNEIYYSELKTPGTAIKNLLKHLQSQQEKRNQREQFRFIY